MTFEGAVAALFDAANAHDAARLAEICDDDIEIVAAGVRSPGLHGVRQWLDASRELRFVVHEVAGEVGETASAVIGSSDATGAERRELIQLRLDGTGQVSFLTVRPAGVPIRTFALLSRRSGLSFEEFIDYYENHHVPLIRSLAPVPLSYTRSYLPSIEDRRFPADFDVVTQMRFGDADAQTEWLGLVTDPASGVAEDEARFLDRSRTRSWVVRVEGDQAAATA